VYYIRDSAGQVHKADQSYAVANLSLKSHTLGKWHGRGGGWVADSDFC